MWRDAVNILAKCSPLVFWRTSDTDKPDFWWAVSATEDHISNDFVVGVVNPDDPLRFQTIRRAYVIPQYPGHAGEAIEAAVWEQLKHDLRGVDHLSVAEVKDIDVGDGTVPHEALALSVTLSLETHPTQEA